MNRKRRRRRARLRRALVAGPPLVGLVLYLIGTRLPPVSRLEVSRQLPTSPESVWAVLTDLDDMPTWREDLRSLERLPERAGAVRWLEVGRGGRTAWERIVAEPPTRLVVREVAGVAGVERTYRIRAVDGGASLALSEERPVRNPFQRVAVAVVGPDRSGVDRFVADLAVRLLGRRQQVVAGAGGQGGEPGGR
jgi:uncharacterized protein YndB with AHSA1/START domain